MLPQYMKCAYKNCDKEIPVDGYKNRIYWSASCKNSHNVSLRRKRTKQLAIDYKGGSCQKCGYNKNLAALEFNHLVKNNYELVIC